MLYMGTFVRADQVTTVVVEGLITGAEALHAEMPEVVHGVEAKAMVLVTGNSVVNAINVMKLGINGPNVPKMYIPHLLSTRQRQTCVCTPIARRPSILLLIVGVRTTC